MWRVTLSQQDVEGAWVFATKEAAQRWCDQFGNTFYMEEVEDNG